MTPLEDKVRRAFQDKADQVPADAMPPLRLPARRRRFLSLAYGGGQRMGASARRGWLAAAASAVLVVTVIAGAVAVSRVMPGSQRPGHEPGAVATSNQAAAWVAAQVSRSAVVSCNPVMCQTLQAYGLPASDLLVLRPGGTGPQKSQVLVATATVRREFGGRLTAAYAPAVIASFGSGSTRIDIRQIAPEGPAAYRSALRVDVEQRKTVESTLANSLQIVAPPRARRQLIAGQVDSRLATLVEGMVTELPMPVDIVAFGDMGPGVSPGVPLRSVTLAGDTPDLRSLLTFARSEKGSYRPAHTEMTRSGGRSVLVIQFDAPSPLELFSPPRHKGT